MKIKTKKDIAFKHGFIRGMSIYSSAKTIEEKLYKAMDEYATQQINLRLMKTHELAKLLLSTKNKDVKASIDISNDENDSDRRIFTDSFFGINDINDDSEVMLLFEAIPMDNYGDTI